MSSDRILISGGASGIGWECANLYANLGARVVILDRSPNLGNLIGQLAGSGHEAYELDVTDSIAVESVMAQVHENGLVTGLVVSAGIVSQQSLLEISSEDFAKVLAVNVTGVQNVVAPVARGMVANNVAGSIVVLGSLAAFNGGGLMGKGAYSTSKAALLGLVRSYARELGSKGVRINTVAPGATATPMTDTLTDSEKENILNQMVNRRFLEASEIVGVIAFLLSDRASAVSGQTIHANGGAFFG